jgi:hypothetical protein
MEIATVSAPSFFFLFFLFPAPIDRASRDPAAVPPDRLVARVPKDHARTRVLSCLVIVRFVSLMPIPKQSKAKHVARGGDNDRKVGLALRVG